MPPRATIVIITKDRCGELPRAIRSALTQGPHEVLVIDDGSSDATSAMVRAEFPSVRLERSERPLGYVVQRNRAAALAKGEVVFSIDDDASFSDPSIVSTTLGDFSLPSIGAVGIPLRQVNAGGRIDQAAPTDDSIWVAYAFIGTAYALRRDLFLRLGGFCEDIFHQGEEADYCARLLDHGFVTRLGSSAPIDHFESLRRDPKRKDLYGRRNDVLFAWRRVPRPFLTFHMIGTTVQGLRFGIRVHRPLRMTEGLLRGYRDIPSRFSQRDPVGRTTYQSFRRLRKRGAAPLDQVLKWLDGT